ncbi:hypothetical protein [Leptospirillum ferrooxidans]|uniref:Uncharacterized protein n=1 Tax=Leptospirillum ferrooxidans (strain C2-3) TaxID=1162668 RepID=I0IMD1_LEPFC|nr:hypothetical protein [Leptospirillum ferrooxidans]BAM06430.1 hypothetical protein LFE_0715 [Leptospirillum ferrooxidans C2-3]
MKILRVIMSVLVFQLLGNLFFQQTDAQAWVVAGKPDYPVAPVHKKLAAIYTEYAVLAKEMDDVLSEKNVSRKDYAPWRASWEKRMMLAEERLHQLYPYFMPINQHPWTREAAVFTNLQGVREWLWTVEQDENSIVDGKPNFDIENGKIYKRNIDMYRGFMLKAGTILTGGPFYGNFFKDTQATILANYCVYPEVHEDGSTHMTKLVKPSFQKMGLQNGLAMEGKGQADGSPSK